MDDTYLETATKSVVELLQQITEKLDQLESIDKSIDFLAAAMTGMDPMDIEMGQTALGRLAIPIMRDTAQKEKKMDENIYISDRIIEEIMEEEINAMLEQDEDPAPWLDRKKPRRDYDPRRTGTARSLSGHPDAETAASARETEQTGGEWESFSRGYGRHVGHSDDDYPSLTGGTIDTPLSPTGPKKQIRPGEKGFVPGEITYRDRLEEIMEEEIKAILEQDADPAPWLSKDAENSRERSWRPPLPEPYDVARLRGKPSDYPRLQRTRPGSSTRRILDLIDDPDLETALAAREAASLNLNHPDDPGDLHVSGVGKSDELTGGTIDTPRSPTGPKKQIRPGEEGFRPGEITYRDRLEEIIEKEIMTMLNQQEV
jgi:hypothetical protein